MSHAKQPKPFDPKRAALLDDPGRERWLPTAAIVSLLAATERARVLDYGTGTARYALAVAKACPSCVVLAYDIQPELLALARERVASSGLKNVTVVSPGSTELRPASFDRVLALNVLHEIDLDELREARAWLRPDGFALVIDWDAHVERDVGPPAAHVYAPEEARERLAEAGFSSELVAESAFPYHFVIRARPEPAEA